MNPVASPSPQPAQRGSTRLPAPVRRRHDREIVALALPAFGALVAEPLFVMVDSAVVGHLGTAQLAGLGVAAALLTTAVNVFVFLAYATTAAVARRIGAGDPRAALRQGVAETTETADTAETAKTTKTTEAADTTETTGNSGEK